MKKILLGATALTVVGFAGVASAQNVTSSPFNVDIGGSATLGLGYVDTAYTDQDNVNGTADGNPITIVDNAEFHLNFSLVADNGLTFGYKMEMEANGGANTADEYVAFVRGSFGTIEIGAEDGAADRLTGFWANYVFSNAGDGTGLLFDQGSTGVAVPDTDGADTGDGLKITYFTPSIAGFEAGVSYAANSNENSTSSNLATTGGANPQPLGDAGAGIEIGARYRNTFGGFSVNVGGGYTYFTSDNTEGAGAPAESGYTLGAVVGFAGFEVSGIYGVDQFDVGNDNETFGLGASYSTGPWLFGVSYAQRLDNQDAALDDSYGIAGEVVYSLAPGVRTGVALEYASDSEEFGAGAAAGTDSAFAAGVFLGLTF